MSAPVAPGTSQRSWLIYAVLLLLVLLIIGFACRRTISTLFQSSNTTITFAQTDTLPTGCLADTPPSDSTRLNACLHNLEFDTTETFGDEQRLMIRTLGPGPRCHGDTTYSCRYGPLAKIEPVKGAHTYGDSALGKGRIIARMFIPATETDSYPKFQMAPGDTTYWWVNTGKDSSYFVRHPHQGGNVATLAKPLQRNQHPPDAFLQGVARWVWDDNDEKVNGSCGSACCR
jgi:hypothetical protein